MTTTYNLDIIEQPISENEAYFAYMLPETDVNYLNKHMRAGYLHNSNIGLFKEKKNSYDRCLVLVKVTETPITSTLKPEETDNYDYMSTHYISHNSNSNTGYDNAFLQNIGIKYNSRTSTFDIPTLYGIKEFTYNYCVVRFCNELTSTDFAHYKESNPFITEYGVNSFETVADMLLASINNYSTTMTELGSVVHAKHYKPHDLLKLVYWCTNSKVCNHSNTSGQVIKLTNKHVAGLYKYVTNKYKSSIAINTELPLIAQHTNPDVAGSLLNNLLLGNTVTHSSYTPPVDNECSSSEDEEPTEYDNYYEATGINFKWPLINKNSHCCTNVKPYIIFTESLTSLGPSNQHISDFTIMDLVGTHIYASSAGRSSLVVYNQYWYEKQSTANNISIVQRIKNIFEQCGFKDFIKICTELDTTTKLVKIKNTVYIKRGYLDLLLKKDPATDNITVKNATIICKLLTEGIPAIIPIDNKYHMEGGYGSDYYSTPIFTKSASGTYNPALEGIDNLIPAPVNMVDVLNSKLGVIFPRLSTQIKMTLFSYQKRNIIWMHDHENKIYNKTLKLNVPYGNFYKIDSLSHTNIELYNYIINSIPYTSVSPELQYNGANIFYKNASATQTLDINLTGGLLCDDVGLGKTLSTICHIVSQKPLDDSRRASWELNNCILVPSRLLQQWKFEIEKYTDAGVLSIVTLGSITDIKKLYKKQANGILVMEKTYDIYIISINLLGNKNYLTYLADNYANENKLNGIERGYFDIFRTKWNRFICDEAHERIMSTSNWGSSRSSGRDNQTMNKADRIITRNIIFNIHANYRWGLTATPLEHATNNILGYLVWFADNIKNQTFDPAEASKLYVSDIMDNGITWDKLPIYKNSFDILPKFITPANLDRFQELCFTKTTKIFVSGEIKIPIFTEEVREIELSQIERSIYNNARADNSNVRHTVQIDRIKRLFQLCTNINISDVDIENMGILPADGQHLTLEQLNASMIKQFQKQLKEVESELSREKATGPDAEAKKVVAKKLKEYMELNIDPDLPRNMNGPIGQKIRYFIEACNNSNGMYNGVSATAIDSMVMKNLRKSLYSRLLECKDSMDNLFVLVSELMSCSPTGQQPDWNDAKTLMITYYLINSFYTKASQNSKDVLESIAKLEREVTRLQNQIKLFQSNDFIKEKTTDPCIICWADYDDTSAIAVTNCRHIFCGGCFHSMGANKTSFPCPECRADIICKNTKVTTMAQIKQADKPAEPEPAPTQTALTLSPGEDPNWKEGCVSKYGTKMTVLIEYLRTIFAEEGKTNRAIIFSQYDNMLKLIGKTLTEYKISNVYCKGNVHVINKNIDKFKRDTSIRVIMLSSEHSNSGSNLTEASHIILVDVLNMDAAQTKDVECQAIGRAVRLGQQKPVKVVRLITKNTIEDEYYRKNKYNIASIQ